MNHLELLYVELVERSNFLKSAEAEQEYSDLEIEIRDSELTSLMLKVSQMMVAGYSTVTQFSKN